MKNALSKILQDNAFKYAGIALLSAAAFISVNKANNFINPKINIHGQSMTPGITPGITYQGKRSFFGSDIERNQIVAILPYSLSNKNVQHPNGPYIKRVVGLPGDTLTFSKQEGNLLKINDTTVSLELTNEHPTFALTSKRPESKGVKIKERPYTFRDAYGGEYFVYQAFLSGDELANDTKLKSFSKVIFNMPFLKSLSSERDIITVKVPDDHYFALSDNRAAGTDSRHFGFVPKDSIFNFKFIKALEQDS
jgi:signal peptidase I